MILTEAVICIIVGFAGGIIGGLISLQYKTWFERRHP